MKLKPIIILFLCIGIWWIFIALIMQESYVNIQADTIKSQEKLISSLQDYNKQLNQENFRLRTQIIQNSELQDVIYSIEPVDYNKQTNNCLDYSKRITSQLFDYNIKSSIGITENREHSLVLIWLDSTTQGFIPADTNYKLIELRDKDLNIKLK